MTLDCPLTRPQAHTARDRSSAGEIRNWPRSGLSAPPVFLRRGMSPNGPKPNVRKPRIDVCFSREERTSQWELARRGSHSPAALSEREGESAQPGLWDRHAQHVL